MNQKLLVMAQQPEKQKHGQQSKKAEQKAAPRKGQQEQKAAPKREQSGREKK